ncbi:MAG: hypothetical protein CL414_02155 [Acidimicrobiaceae bacterium]|nr:hypothetical protein [Acidimicrobiaceae bacterium]
MSGKLSSPLSLKWWFEDRSTGRVVVAQQPNLLLLLCLVALGAAWIWSDSLAVAVISKICWLTWSADELFRGVNPWRRVLGVVVGVVTLVS